MFIVGNGAVININSYVVDCQCQQQQPIVPDAVLAEPAVDARPAQHTTRLLLALEAAKREFWSTYDPPNHTTAPRSQDVSAWLQDQGVAKRVAEVMAQILRADDLPAGPRTFGTRNG